MELSQQITQCRISELIAKQYLIKNGESYSINISKDRLRKKNQRANYSLVAKIKYPNCCSFPSNGNKNYQEWAKGSF